MQGTLSQWLAATSPGDREAARKILEPLIDRLSCQSLAGAGLVIKAGGSAIVKNGVAWYGLVQGKLVTKAINTDMPALSGTVTNAKFNVYAFFVDSAGTVTSQMGTEGATLAAVVFPAIPVGKTLIGFVIINPTGTGNFVGGTTPLDDATVAPGALYVSPHGAIDPSALI